MKTTSANMPRVEIVGSFLPPEELENALNDKIHGVISEEAYHEVEDRVIDRLIDREIEAGLQIVTDGEMRRKSWDRDFWEGFNGMSRERIDTGHIYQDETVRHDLLRFNGRIEYNPAHPFFEKYSHMQELTAGRAEVRQTIPSPGALYMRILLSCNGDFSKIYDTPETLLDDIVAAYRATIEEFYRHGCRHIQLDTGVWGRLSDPYFDRILLLGGVNADEVTATLLSLINRTIEGRPADLEITLSIAADETIVPRWFDDKEQAHLRRMLQEVDADAFLLPFAISSPEEIDVVRFIPAGKRAIIGLVDGSLPNVENIDDIVTAIRVAARHIPVSLLSVSPTCGFKVTDRERQGLNYETQWGKIALLQEAAERFAGNMAE
ncbi:MAG: hypothetical protein NC212_03590 [Staphylococcus sp.]|nr:hypothetical protein [Staphylococcus sp.]